MSDETRIEDEDGGEVDAHFKPSSFKPSSVTAGDESDDVHFKPAGFKPSGFKPSSAAEGDEVEAHFKLNQ